MDVSEHFDNIGMNFSQFKIPELPIVDLSDIPTNFMWSDTQFELIRKYISNFEDSLDNEYEVGVMLTNFGQSVVMQVTEIGYEKSVLMIFKGYVNGQRATLIQHVNQLNFLLVATTRSEPEKPKHRIGFKLIDNKGK